jgi:hypothetical protein
LYFGGPKYGFIYPLFVPYYCGRILPETLPDGVHFLCLGYATHIGCTAAPHTPPVLPGIILPTRISPPPSAYLLARLLCANPINTFVIRHPSRRPPLVIAGLVPPPVAVPATPCCLCWVPSPPPPLSPPPPRRTLSRRPSAAPPLPQGAMSTLGLFSLYFCQVLCTSNHVFINASH